MDIIQTTLTSAKQLHNFIKSCGQFSQDANSLARRFDWDLRVLAQVSNHFQKQVSSSKSQLNAEDQILLDTSVAYLGDDESGSSRNVQD
jgi:hypothetical protein